MAGTAPGYEQKANLANLLGTQRIVALTTRTAGGRLLSRPMYLCLGADESLWFFTLGSDRIAHEIERDACVSVNGRSSDGARFVSISGRARLSDDADVAGRLWDPALDDWFPGGLGYPGIQIGHPGLQLIQVLPDRVEYWDEAVHRVLSDSTGADEGRRSVGNSGAWTHEAQRAHHKLDLNDSEGEEREQFEEATMHRSAERDEVQVLMASDEAPD